MIQGLVRQSQHATHVPLAADLVRTQIGPGSPRTAAASAQAAKRREREDARARARIATETKKGPLESSGPSLFVFSHRSCENTSSVGRLQYSFKLR